MKYILTLVFITFSILCHSQNKVCFSYDDLPVVSYGIDDTVYQGELINKLVSLLNKNNIPAIGFANEIKMRNQAGEINFQVSLLSKWAGSGLDLGNHSYSHFDYNNLSCNEFTNDIIKGETILKRVLAANGKEVKYFRHPFLHVGNTKEKADSLSKFLLAHGYKTAPVTIDNEDYLFAVAYKRALQKQDSVLAGKIKADFIQYIELKVKYYEKQSTALFGRNISQILLVHASKLNADCVDALAEMFRTNNYTFVSMDEVLKDEAYNTPVTKFGEWGISWIDRWALSQGKKGDFFKDEPVTPDYIKELAK
jgi:peptidoglycan/xylan/chitin deacetylase (PgdA/CDA1 family)